MLKICTLLILVTNYVICTHIESINHFQSGKENTLNKDFSDFIDIIPMEDIRNLTKYFYANDERMRESYDYLRNDGYQVIVNSLSQVSIIKKFFIFLNETGVNFIELKNKARKVMLTNKETESIVLNGKNIDGLGGMDAYFSECLLLIPQDEVLTTFFAKMEQSNAFSSFLEKLSTSDYENLLINLQQSQQLQILYYELTTHGIDILEWGKSLKSFFGY